MFFFPLIGCFSPQERFKHSHCSSQSAHRLVPFFPLYLMLKALNVSIPYQMFQPCTLCPKHLSFAHSGVLYQCQMKSYKFGKRCSFSPGEFLRLLSFLWEIFLSKKHLRHKHIISCSTSPKKFLYTIHCLPAISTTLLFDFQREVVTWTDQHYAWGEGSKDLIYI